MQITLTSGCKEILNNINLPIEDVRAACELPTLEFSELSDHGLNAETHEVIVDGGQVYSAVRWFEDGRVLYVAGNGRPFKGTKKPKQLEVAIVALLKEDLPAGKVTQDMSVPQIERVLAESFGLPIRCHPSSRPELFYSGKWDGRFPPIDSHRFLGRFTMVGEFNHEKRLCRNAWAFSLEKYLAWFPRPAREILALPAVKASLGSRRPSSRREATRATHTAGVLEFHCNELVHLLKESGDKEEVLHQWLLAPQHHVFLEKSAVEIRSKVPFGSKVSDFVIRKSNETYSVVEIERASARIFQRRNGEPTAEFNHACQQVRDWQRYIRDNVHTVRTEQGLIGISQPAGTVIIGRSSDIDSDEARSRWLDMKNNHEFTILTYDDLCESVRALARILRQVVA